MSGSSSSEGGISMCLSGKGVTNAMRDDIKIMFSFSPSLLVAHAHNALEAAVDVEVYYLFSVI